MIKKERDIYRKTIKLSISITYTHTYKHILITSKKNERFKTLPFAQTHTHGCMNIRKAIIIIIEWKTKMVIHLQQL